QQAGQIALARAGHGNPGGFVALDPRNGQVLALGSVPSFNPTVFAKPLLQSTYRSLTSQATGAPLFNRAIAGAYPTGSTFKPITALAGLNAGVITPYTVINDGGCLTVGVARAHGPCRAALPPPAPRPHLRDLRHARLVDRRQRQPVDRPGRPARLAAADGGRLLDDRQRRQGRAPAPRAGGRRRPGPPHP